MIKKINKYLLENYPLLWNTKVVWMLLILCLAHIVFYLIGFLSYYSPEQLHEYDSYNIYFSGGFIWIGILLSILIFILWLNQYFKQNAFKLYYPKSNISLFSEFIIIFLICFLNISFYLSYTPGFKNRVSSTVSMEELKKEVDIVNKTSPFTLNRSSYGYECSNRCVEVPAFDTLVSENEVLELYIKNRIKYDYNPAWKKINPEDYLLYRDSLPQPYYSNYEFEELLTKHFPQRRTNGVIYNDDYEDINNYEDYPEVVQEVAPADPQYNLTSLYNYCSSAVVTDSAKDQLYYALHTAYLLENNNKDSIQKIMSAYSEIADKYKVSYRFIDNKWIDYVYNPPYYFVDHDLSVAEIYNHNYSKTKPKDHVLHYNMENTMQNLLKSKSRVVSPESILFLCYLALGLAMLIFTFRTTTVRTWVISLVGTIVMFFVFLAVFFFINISTHFGYKSQDIILLWQMFIFIIIFWIIAIRGLKTQKNKLVTGVALNWAIWTFPAIIPLAIIRYMTYLNSIIYYDKYQPDYWANVHYSWINDNAVLLGYLNILVFILFLFVIIRLLKKWKAMPEE